MRIFSKGAVAALVVLTSLVISGGAGGAEPKIAGVVKIGGIPWFTAMEKGDQGSGQGTERERSAGGYYVIARRH